jgi:hypothetical protein
MTQVAGSDLSTCAMKPDGTLRCWGYNGQNQLGNGTTTTAITPVDRAGPVAV